MNWEELRHIFWFEDLRFALCSARRKFEGFAANSIVIVWPENFGPQRRLTDDRSIKRSWIHTIIYIFFKDDETPCGCPELCFMFNTFLNFLGHDCPGIHNINAHWSFQIGFKTFSAVSLGCSAQKKRKSCQKLQLEGSKILDHEGL